jgi:signal transduction histidine kinase
MKNTLSAQFDANLLANFIHQVINPLNAVCGTLDNLADGTLTGARRFQRLRAARAQLEQCVGLVRNLAYFAGTSLGPTGTRNVPADEDCVVPEIIIEAAQFFQEMAASRGIKIRLDDRVTQYTIKGSKPLLRQVFMNLFDNAVKYSGNDTEITVHPWVQKDTKNLLITVSNRGISIDKGEEEKIFEVGYRGNQARQKIATGSGLGLNICQIILQTAFEAKIGVEPSHTAGETVFLLRFPGCDVRPNRIIPETGRRERTSKAKGPPHRR